MSALRFGSAGTRTPTASWRSRGPAWSRGRLESDVVGTQRVVCHTTMDAHSLTQPERRARSWMLAQHKLGIWLPMDGHLFPRVIAAHKEHFARRFEPHEGAVQPATGEWLRTRRGLRRWLRCGDGWDVRSHNLPFVPRHEPHCHQAVQALAVPPGRVPARAFPAITCGEWEVAGARRKVTEQPSCGQSVATFRRAERGGGGRTCG